MSSSKLVAEWFWTDRWVGSSAFLLPLEARGLYREILTQAWRRGARLPNDHEAIQRAVGCTEEEWERNWPLIAGYFRVKNGKLFNPTQVEIYKKTLTLLDTRRDAARLGGLKTQALKRQAKSEAQLEAQVKAGAKPRAEAKNNSPSPSPSPEQNVQKHRTPPAAVSELSREPSTDGNFKIIQRLAHAVMDESGLTDPESPELTDLLKAACAKHRIDYGREVSPDVIRRALMSASVQRKIAGGQRDFANTRSMR